MSIIQQPKTIFLDIDGTLIEFDGDIVQHLQRIDDHELIDNDLWVNKQRRSTHAKLREWDDKGYRIILTTGRRESHRHETEASLKKLGIFYDQLIMGLGGGKRVLINDMREGSDEHTAIAINLKRNSGIATIIDL